MYQYLQSFPTIITRNVNVPAPKALSSGSAIDRWSQLKPSIYNILHWVAWMMGQTNHQPIVWCSKYYICILFIGWGHSKLFVFSFVNIYKKIKKYIEIVFAKKFWRNHENWIILGTSDTWLTSHLSQQTSVSYCRLSDFSICYNSESSTKHYNILVGVSRNCSSKISTIIRSFAKGQ